MMNEKTRRPEDMTVEEMAEVLGYTSREHPEIPYPGRIWEDAAGEVVGPLAEGGGRYVSWPDGGYYEGEDDTHTSEHAAMSRLYRLRFPETDTPPTPIVKPEPTTARESAIPSAIDTRAVLTWLDAPVPLDDDRRPRFLRMAEMVGRGMGGGR